MSDMYNINTEASRIAKNALCGLLGHLPPADDWRIRNGADLASYCLTGEDGDECDSAAQKFHLDAEVLRDEVREHIEASFNPAIHRNA